MPRVVELRGIIEDGTSYVSISPQTQPQAIQAAYGEALTIHLLVFNPSGHQVRATSQRVITYGARAKPLPDGQLLFQHIADISPVGDGGWDLAIVPHDYVNVVEGAGRFVFDVWLTDNTLSPPQSCPVQPLAQFIVTPSAVSVSGPSTAPVPQRIVAYGLPASSPSGAVLTAQGVSGAVNSVIWQVPPWAQAIEQLIVGRPIAAGTYVAQSTAAGQVVPFNVTTMSPLLIQGVARSTGPTAGLPLDVVTLRGAPISPYLDAVGSPTGGSILYHSEVTPGRVSTSEGVFGMIASVARGGATAGSPVSARF